MKVILFVLSLLILPLQHYGQSFLNVEGTWQINIDETSYCTIIMMEDEWDGQPLVVLEGMLHQQPFQVRCRVEHIPQRQSIALYELAGQGGNKNYDSDRPLICFFKQTGGNITPLWCQMQSLVNGKTAKEIKAYKVKKINIPGYKDKYRFTPFKAPTASVMN